MRRWKWPPARLGLSLAIAIVVLAGCGLLDDPPSGGATTTIGATVAPVVRSSLPEAAETSSTTTVDASPPSTVPEGGAAPDGALLLRADLTGAASVPGPGDPDGSARAILTSDEHGDEICFSLIPTNLAAPTGLHVHQGAAGAEGPIVIDLTRPDTNSTRGCMAIPEGALERVVAAPGDFYVDVHTAEPPGVAARGQLS